MDNSHLGRAVCGALKAMNKLADDNLPERIVTMCKVSAGIAAASGLAAGWVPGAGGTIAVTISAGTIWHMYYKINEEIGLPFTQHLLKSIATAVATNLASYLASILVAQGVISFIPGIGSVGSMAIMGIACYALTLASAYVYLRVLTTLFVKGYNVTDIDAEKMKATAKEVIENDDIKAVFAEAKAAAKKAKAHGEFKKSQETT